MHPRTLQTPGVVTALTALLLALGVPAAAGAQATLFGRVSDATGAPVSGAAVALTTDGAEGRTTATDTRGDYELTEVPAGRYRVEVRAVGFAPVGRQVQLASSDRRRADFSLRPQSVVIEGMVVEGRDVRDPERTRFENEPGVTARVVTGEAIKSLPGLAEPDVLRAVEVLPGVISTSDFSSAYNVRGGSADENLILLDGFTVFNPFHLGGLFSVFNSDAVARAELLAGGFGAEHGARVSSVLDIETEGGSADHVEVMGGVSMLAARALVRGPLPHRLARLAAGDRGRWMLSARRSYFDQLLRPIASFPYHLTDLQGYTEVGLPKGKLSFTAYSGDDLLDLSNFDPPSTGSDSSSILRIQWKWGNRVLGGRWQQAVGSHWVADSRLGWSGFSNQLGFVDFSGIRFGSTIGQLTLHSQLARDYGTTGTAILGGELARTHYHNYAQAGGTEFFSARDQGVLGSTFASFRWRPTESWLVEPGIRGDVWWGSHGSTPLLSPRFAVKRFFGPTRTFAAKLAVGRYTQFLHSLRNEDLPVSNDTWVLTGQGTPAVVSDQLQTGIEKYWGEEWYASLEGYARGFRGVTELNPGDDPNNPDDQLLAGKGRSVGLDIFARRNTGRLTGWTAISLLHATRTFPDALAAGFDDLSPTVTFPPIFDRHVDVDLVLQYLLAGKWELSGRWNYGSPIPYTRPAAQYLGFQYSILNGTFKPANEDGSGNALYVAPGPRNAERYPTYHRLDATVRRTYTRSWGSYTPYLQVLNVYNQKNVLFYFYNFDRLPPTRTGISMFPVLPALGVEMKF